MALAEREKAIKAIKTLDSRSVSVIFNAKKRGRNIKRFFTY